jgi:hypothetical protein
MLEILSGGGTLIEERLPSNLVEIAMHKASAG